MAGRPYFKPTRTLELCVDMHLAAFWGFLSEISYKLGL